MGRKWEIEHALFKTVEEALAENQEYIICRQHKTSKTYGDIIKYLSPGLVQALIVYKRLPRPSLQDCKYFLVPVNATTQTISIPNSLKTFSRNFLKDAKVHPTTNQVRKLFHKELMKLTKDEDAVKDFMTILDAHGRKVQDKHYLMRDPADDLACAKVLVAKVLGQTVAWPTEAGDGAGQALSLAKELENLLTGLDAQENVKDAIVDGVDSEDEPFDHWAFGELFGIKPVGQLDILPLMDCDVEATPFAGKKKDKKTKEKGEKKDKKEKEKKQKKDDKEKKVKKGEKGRKRTEADAEQEQDVDVQKHLYWDQFAHKPSPGSRRTKVDPPAHQAIWAALFKWQEDEGKDADARPGRAWYWDLRCELIGKGHLSVHHCWDVCRNSVRDQLEKARKAEIAAAQSTAQHVD